MSTSHGDDLMHASHAKFSGQDKLRSLFTIILASVLFTTARPVAAQTQTVPAVGAVDGSVQPPIPGGHDYIHLISETVNPATGQLTVRVALPVAKGRGITPPAVLAYNSAELSALTLSGENIIWPTSTANPAGQANGWGSTGPAPLSLNNTSWSYTAPPPPGGGSPTQGCQYRGGYSFTDLQGVSHTLAIGAMAPVPGDQCGSSLQNLPQWDGQVQGLLTGTPDQVAFGYSGNGIGIIDLNGNNYGSSAKGAMEDRNGNYLSLTSNSATNGTDTVGRPMTLQIYPVANPYTIDGITYTVSTVTDTFSYKITPAVSTALGANCTAPEALPANSATLTVIDSIALPNGQKYQFKYDSNYGTIKEIDFPGGGSVQYTWSLSSDYQQVTSFPGPSQNGPMNVACTLEWQIPVVTSRKVEFDGSTAVQSQSFDYTTQWDQNGDWTSKSTTVWTTDQKAGNSFKTVYSYTPMSGTVPSPFNTANFPTTPVEQSIQRYDWGNPAPAAPLDTVTEAWYNQYQKACEIHTLNNGRSYGHFYMWQYGFIADDKVYDFGSVSDLSASCSESSLVAPANTTPTRETVTEFKQFASPIPPNLTFAKPSSVTIYNNGSEIAQTLYAYDEYSLTPVPNLTNHDETLFAANSTYPPPQGRGNLTTLLRKCISGTGCTQDSVVTYTYDEAGQIATVKDGCGNVSCGDMSGATHTTTYSFLDSYPGGGAPSQTDAYLTKITYPPVNTTHEEDFSYDWTSGEVLSAKDENGQTTTYQYNDSLKRLTGMIGPADSNNGGAQPTTSVAYTDATPNSTPISTVTTSVLLNTSNVSKTSVAIVDGMGHTIQTQLTSDPYGIDYVDTSYDGEERVKTRSNPYRCTSPPTAAGQPCTTPTQASTNGTTTFNYDAMGRTVAQFQPDGNSVLSCYNNVASAVLPSVTSLCSSQLGSLSNVVWVDSLDENANHWQRSSDSFGNLLEVMEPNGSTQAPTMETDYQYNGFNELLRVDQWGGAKGGTGDRVRTSTYDSLARLISATNPESGTTSYVYDANGNLSSKTDARAVQTSYSYDALNRLLAKNYSSGDPSACTQYDTPLAVVTDSFPVGRVTAMWTAPANSCPTSGQTVSSIPSTSLTSTAILEHDVMGHVTAEQQCPYGSSCGSKYAITYKYDLAGDSTGLSNNVGAGTNTPLNLTACFDGAAHVNLVTGQTDFTCGQSTPTFPQTLYTLTGYGPTGPLTWTLGSNLTVSQDYTNRLWIQDITATGQVPQ